MWILSIQFCQMKDEVNRMKNVLVFNGYYIPAKKYGGPLTSLATVVEHCSAEFQFYIIAANHDLNEKSIFTDIHTGWNQVGKAKVLYVDLREVNYKTKLINMIIKEIQPAFIWIAGILVPASKWNVAHLCRKNNIPYLISPRGELCGNAIQLKKMKKIIVIGATNIFGAYKSAFYHATSQEEIMEIEKYYHVTRERIFLVPNISASLVAKKRSIKKARGEVKAVFIARIQEKKNLLEAIKAVNSLAYNVSFDIYGPQESSEYWKQCNEEIDKAPPSVKIRYCGALQPEDVPSTFEKYHCFLFPTLSENYGHVITEALSVSCPVVLSKGTTPWDDIDGCAGYTYRLKAINEFSAAISRIAEMDQREYDNLVLTTKLYFNRKAQEDNAVSKHVNMFRAIQ